MFICILCFSFISSLIFLNFYIAWQTKPATHQLFNTRLTFENRRIVSDGQRRNTSRSRQSADLEEMWVVVPALHPFSFCIQRTPSDLPRGSVGKARTTWQQLCKHCRATWIRRYK